MAAAGLPFWPSPARYWPFLPGCGRKMGGATCGRGQATDPSTHGAWGNESGFKERRSRTLVPATLLLASRSSHRLACWQALEADILSQPPRKLTDTIASSPCAACQKPQ